MATYTKLKLSGSTDGKQIAVGATSTTVHTAHATALDEIWMWGTNPTAAAIEITIEWGGTTAADNLLVTVPLKSGDLLIIAGKILTNSLVFGVKASTGLNVSGYVNRIA